MGHKALLLLSMLALGAVAGAQDKVDSALLPAEVMPLVPESLLIDVARIGDRFVAVGERGHILLSNDGESWRQAGEVPTRSTLNAVSGRGDLLWAVGHDSVILHSEDGGESWVRQFADPAQSSEDDPNPLFDVLFLDDQRGLVLGSYGRLLVTDDGGESWTENAIGDLLSDEVIEVDEDDEGDSGDSYEDQFGEEDQYYDYHLNGIAMLSDGTLFIAGEAGNSYLSRDDGESWAFVPMPYEGSMFGVMAVGERLVAYGLRGNVLESDDGGVSWIDVETGTLNSIMGGTSLEDGTEILVGANGEILLRRPGGRQFVSYAYPGGEDLGAVTALSGMTVILVGEVGVDRFTPGAGS